MYVFHFEILFLFLFEEYSYDIIRREISLINKFLMHIMIKETTFLVLFIHMHIPKNEDMS